MAGVRSKCRPLAGGADGPTPSLPRDPVVLVVEDHADTRELYHQFLATMGFRVAEAATCAEALDQARRGGLDAVVLDRSLPDGDGIDVCRQLKADPRTSGLVIILLSGRAKAGDVDADAYLMKPIDPLVLAEELTRLIAKRDGAGDTAQT